MKKNYVAPMCTSYNLKIGTLCEGSYGKRGDVTAQGTSGGWSKGYAGGIEDDSSDDLWAEE